MRDGFIGSIGMAIVAGALLALASPGTGDQAWLAYGDLSWLLAGLILVALACAGTNRVFSQGGCYAEFCDLFS